MQLCDVILCKYVRGEKMCKDDVYDNVGKVMNRENVVLLDDGRVDDICR